MPADKNPVFRKAVIPWYNSTTAHIIVVLFMLLVIIFAVAGLAVARENPAYQGYIWVPILLLERHDDRLNSHPPDQALHPKIHPLAPPICLNK